MAIQKKIQLYVSDVSGNQKTAKYYRIPLPADTLPFNKETNIFKNLIHFYCVISGDSATFGAIGFNEPILTLYEESATHHGSYDGAASVNYTNITPTIPEKLLSDGELSFDVYGSNETIHYNSADGYGTTSPIFSSNTNGDQTNYLAKIVKKSGIFKASNVIRSNSENELSQFVPSTWKEFDSMDELLADVRSRINDVKTLDRGELFTYDECTTESNTSFKPGIGTIQNSLGAVNDIVVLDLMNLNVTSGQTIETGCNGHQRVLSFNGTPSSSDYDFVLDTANLTDEIAIVSKTNFLATSNTVEKIQPNSGTVTLTDKFSAYGTAIVFKNKADSANIVLKTVGAAKPLDELMELIKREDAPKNSIVKLLKTITNSELVPSGVALPPRMSTTDVPISDFYQIKGSDNFRFIDANRDTVTFKFTPGTKFRLLLKSYDTAAYEVDVDNSTGTYELNTVIYSNGITSGAKLYLVKYDATDITVSW